MERLCEVESVRMWWNYLLARPARRERVVETSIVLLTSLWWIRVCEGELNVFVCIMQCDGRFV